MDAGSRDDGRTLGAWITGAFLLALGGVSLIDLASGVRATAGPADPDLGLLDGERLRAIEDRLEEGSQVASVLRPRWSELLYRTTGHLRESVVPGRDGWFFLATTLRDRAPHALEAGVAWADAARVALLSRDIELAVLLVPSKVTVRPDRLRHASQAPPSSYEELVRSMRAEGLRVVDLLTLFESRRDLPLYLPDDTHWTRHGAWLAAERLAEEVGGAGTFAPRVTVAVEWAERLLPPGDLLRMAGFVAGGDLETGLRTHETYPEVTFTSSGESYPEVFLAGDSFAANGKLASCLIHFLETEVGDLSRVGEGPSAGLGFLMSSLEAVQHEPRLVVWAFVERQLREPESVSWSPLLAGIAELYREGYRELAPLSCGLDANGIGRIDLAEQTRWVLPGNGTSALRLVTNFDGARRVGVSTAERTRDPRDAPALDIAPGEARSFLPIVRSGFLDDLTLTVDPARRGVVEVSLWSAYRAKASISIESLEVRDVDGRSVHSFDLPEAVTADGTHAVALTLRASGSRSGTGRLLDADTRDSTSQGFPVRGGAEVTCIVPLERPGAGVVRRVDVEISGCEGTPDLSRIELLEL